MFIIFNLIIFAICNAKRIKANAECLKQEEPLTKSKAQTYFTSECETECLTENGWLNVGYLKWLISNLKTKNVSANDLIELEDFEVYLLNFTTRQPNAYERKVLSTRINSLIKKIARYGVG